MNQHKIKGSRPLLWLTGPQFGGKSKAVIWRPPERSGSEIYCSHGSRRGISLLGKGDDRELYSSRIIFKWDGTGFAVGDVLAMVVSGFAPKRGRYRARMGLSDTKYIHSRGLKGG